MRSIELFSGAGGLALGLEQAGFQSVAFFERDGDACATLRLNRPSWRVVESDVRHVRFADYGPVDLVAGGPPCQPFSMGGKAKGHEDHRDMFPQAVRAVRELRPLGFVFENVRGLLRPAFTNYVEFIRLQLTYPDFPISDNVSWESNLRRLERHHTSQASDRGLTYNVTLNLADAADYGVPQRRHRVFFVGFRADLGVQWSFPKPSHSRAALLWSQRLGGEYWAEHGLSGPELASVEGANLTLNLPSSGQRWRTVRDAIAGLGEPKRSGPWSNHSFQPGAKAYPGHTGSALDEPSKALKAGGHGVPGGENMMRFPDGTVRYFSIREAARMQTFPDEWVFGSCWSESMRQLGNAVPVRLARVVAASVAAKLKPHVASHDLQSTR